MGTPMLPKTDPEMRRALRHLILRCGLDPNEYKPYSLRRGGATHLYKIIGNMSSVIERGRWASVKTARIYVQEAEAMLKAMHLTTRQQDNIQKGMHVFHQLCGF